MVGIVLANLGAILIAVNRLGLGLVVLIGIVLVGKLIAVNGALDFEGFASRRVEMRGAKTYSPSGTPSSPKSDILIFDYWYLMVVRRMRVARGDSRVFVVWMQRGVVCDQL